MEAKDAKSAVAMVKSLRTIQRTNAIEVEKLVGVDLHKLLAGWTVAGWLSQ